MLRRLRKAAEQLGHLAHETREINGTKWWRWGGVWFTDAFWAVASYRLSRTAYLALGPGWSAARVALGPVLYGLRPWSGRCEISYKADIGRGLRVLHPTLGVVVSAKTVAGTNLILTGGNCIGARKALDPGAIRIGDDVVLGANATILGPIFVADRTKVGAGAVLVRDTEAEDVVAAPAPQRLPPRPR